MKRPCRCRVEQYGTTVVNICKKYIQTVRHACRKTFKRHHSTVGASQYSWCKHQDVMQTRCSHDVRATGRHLRLDMVTHRDSFPILHNFYRLRYIMVSFRAHPSTQKNCITEDSCILQYLRSLRSERADVPGSTDCGTVPALMCRYFSNTAILSTGGVLLYLPHHLDLASEDSVGHSTCISVLVRRRAIMGSIVQPKRSCLGLSR